MRRGRGGTIGLFAVVNLAALLIVYFGWVYFSYLLIPVKKPSEYRIKMWPHDGYYKLEPGIYEQTDYGVVYTINGRGFRTPDFATERGPAFRIIALGESSTQGLESPEGATWPDGLQRLLSASGSPVEVINAGISASSSPHHLAMLRAELLGYRPDLIVYYAGHNDYVVTRAERYPGPELWDRGKSFFRPWFMFKRIQFRLLVLKTVGVDLEDWLPYWSNATWITQYRANLGAMLRETEAAGVPVLLVTQLLDYPPEVLETILRREGTASFARHLSFRNAFWHMYLRQHDTLKVQTSVAREFRHARILDVHAALARAGSADRPLFFDDVHLTPTGNDVVARAIAPAVRDHYLAASLTRTVREADEVR